MALWFKGFKRHSGFDKTKTIESNLKTMYSNAKLKNPVDRWLRVGRQAQSLANLTKDRETRDRAIVVAHAAFRKVEKLHELGR